MNPAAASSAAAQVADAWLGAVRRWAPMSATGEDVVSELFERYRDPGRHYHDVRHVASVLTDAGWLAGVVGLDPEQRAVLDLAACAHDVVYDGRAGDDERASAAWAVARLAACAVPAPVAERVSELILATADHVTRPDDVTAAVLLDADLAVLGRDPHGYAAYVSAVRADYEHVPEADWRRGRAAVLSELLQRSPLFATHAARERWENLARTNMRVELAALDPAAARAHRGEWWTYVSGR